MPVTDTNARKIFLLIQSIRRQLASIGMGAIFGGMAEDLVVEADELARTIGLAQGPICFEWTGQRIGGQRVRHVMVHTPLGRIRTMGMFPPPEVVRGHALHFGFESQQLLLAVLDEWVEWLGTSSSPQRPATDDVPITQAEANRRARPILIRNRNINARQLAIAVGCSLGMVSKLPAWKAVQEKKTQLQRDAKKPKVIRLTKKLERVADGTDAERDATLAELIVDQAEDDQAATRTYSSDRDAGEPRRARVR